MCVCVLISVTVAPVMILTLWCLIRYAIFGSREDYKVVLKFRTGAYKVHNLHILDQQGTHKIDNLRLIGIGGDVNTGKLLDSGEFSESTVAGDRSGMWITLLQLGQLARMAAKVYNPNELRMLVSHANPAQATLVTALAVALKVDAIVFPATSSLHSTQYFQSTVRSTLALNKLVEE